MKQILKTVFLSSSYALLCINPLFIAQYLHATNFGSSGANVEGDSKQAINYYGTLITQQGQKNNVENISIGGKTKDIIMYDCPIKHLPEEINTKTKQPEIKLDTNPTKDFVKSKIDLSKISEIAVPSPNTIWLYQPDEKHQRHEFTQVLITYPSSKQAKPYLLEHKTQILCNSIENDNAQKKEVPLAAIDKIIIEGYAFGTKSDQKKESAECVIEKHEHKEKNND